MYPRRLLRQLVLKMTSSVEDRKRRYNKYIYRVEETRQKSIELSPIADICDPVRFSAAGFYYTGYGSKLKCFECCVEIDEWSRGDNPWLDHQRAKASCRFIRNIACGNVPRGVSPQLIPMEGDPHCIPTDFRASYRVPSTSREEDRTFYAEFYIDLEMEEYSNPPIEEHCVGISTTPPAEKDLVSYESRLNTFYYWPKYISQTKESMAEAGFFYSSIGDYVICHHCGNGIKDWKNNEDPWEEHARYFPECYFLRLIKGNDFVERYSLQYNFEKSEESTEEKKIKKKKDKIKKDKKSKKEDDTFVCKICYNEPLSVIFLPCLHMVTCVKCAPAIDKCIICRVHIPGVIQPIIS